MYLLITHQFRFIKFLQKTAKPANLSKKPAAVVKTPKKGSTESSSESDSSDDEVFTLVHMRYLFS